MALTAPKTPLHSLTLSGAADEDIEQFIIDAGVTPSADIVSDLRKALADVLSLSDYNAYSIQDLWKRYQLAGYPNPAPTVSDITSFTEADTADITAVPDPQGVWVSKDGTKVFVVSDSPTERAYHYTMGTPFDLTTLSKETDEKDFGSSRSSDIFLTPDGTKLFIAMFSTEIGVKEYTLSTPFDLSTADTGTLFATSGAGATSPQGLHFKDDGLVMYVSDNNDSVYQWTLSAAWDTSSPTFDGSYSVAAQVNAAYGISIDESGTKMFISDLVSNSLDICAIFQYTLSTPFDITTGVSYSSLSVTTFERGKTGMHLVQENGNERIFVAYNGDDAGQTESIEQWTV